MAKDTRVRIDSAEGAFLIDKTEWENWSSNYKSMFSKLMRDLKDDERVDTIIFGYNDSLRGNTISIYTKRCTLFSADIVFAEDHSNDNEVVSKLLDTWFKLPAVESDKEQFEGVWKKTGKKVRFNRIWNNYRFSDDECRALLEGEHIEFNSPSKNGDMKKYCGILDEQEFNGFKFFGFKLDGWAVPDEFLTHKLTENEKTMLRAGKEVKLTKLWSEKKKKFFDAFCTYNSKEGIKIAHF